MCWIYLTLIVVTRHMIVDRISAVFGSADLLDDDK